jgi:hypothetical protein
MAEMKRMVGKSKLTGADITGQKYDTQIKEEAAKIRLKVRMKEKLTRYEKSVLDADAAIKKMNTQPASKKISNGSDTKPFNVQLMKPAEIIKDKVAVKKAMERTVGKSKPATKATPKTTTKAPAKKLVGPAAVAELKKQVSKAGVKKAEANVKKAVDKKYPGLYKKSK